MSNETKIPPRHRVSAVLDLFDFPEGERPEITMFGVRLQNAWAAFPLNALGDTVTIVARGEVSIGLDITSTVDRAKRVAAFLNGLDAEPAPSPAPEIIGTASADAPPLTDAQIATVKVGDEVWVDDRPDHGCPSGWHQVIAFNEDNFPQPFDVAVAWDTHHPMRYRIRAHRPRREG